MERRRWSPDVSAAHYRVYAWWSSKTGKQPVRENFCHYWRVVAIWAPLRWLAKPVAVLLLAALFVAVAWTAFVYTGEFMSVVLTVVGFAYIGASVMVGKHLFKMLIDADLEPVGWLEDRNDTVQALAALLALPVLIVVGVVLLVAGCLLWLLESLGQDYDIYDRSWRWLTRSITETKGLSWLNPLYIIAALALVVGLAWPVTRPFTMVIGLLLIIVVLLLGVLATLSYFVDRSRERSEAESERQEELSQARFTEALMQVVFAYYHPKRAGDAYQYQAWRQRYDRYVMRNYGRTVGELNPLMHLRWIPYPREQELTYAAEVASTPVVEPNWFDKAVSAASDYLSLIWSVILTNKWKICPTVSLPTPPRRELV